MSKLVKFTFLVIVLIFPVMVSAHGADRVAGMQTVEELNRGTVRCEALADAQFENMGDYYMEQMMGETHEQMDTMMEQMMGEEGLTQMHVAMGKRMSSCDSDAPMPAAMMSGMMNMMGMMSGGAVGSSMMGSGSGMMGTQNYGSAWRNMMSGTYPPGFVTLWYVVGVLAAVALVFAIVKYLRELFK